MLRTLSISLPDNLGVSESLLIFDGEILLAVVGLLSDEMFEASRGQWHVEATFTHKLGLGDMFDDLSTAMDRLGS